MKSITVKIDKAVYGGYGLGFHEGKAVLVLHGLPGDVAEIGVTEEKKDYLSGVVNKIHEPSEGRTIPSCPNFGNCGGCDYLNSSYEHELEIKKGVLLDCLRRIAKTPADSLPDIHTVSGNRLHYRSHASIKADPAGRVGFYARGTSELVPFPGQGCSLLSEDVLDGLSVSPAAGGGDFRVAVGMDSVPRFSFGRDQMVREMEKDVLYERDIQCFFQSNHFLRSKLLRITGDYAELAPGESFLDLGCGVGFFTLYLAGRCTGGVGVDISSRNIVWANHNKKINNMDHVAFRNADVTTASFEDQKPEAIIVDPPRAGIAPSARKRILSLHPERLVYISCNPSTFARDSLDFREGGYELKKLTLIDMFPGTCHIEVISQFVRSGKIL